jgi:hypothetical protein
VPGGHITDRKGAGAQAGDAYHWHFVEIKMNAPKFRFAFCHHGVQMKIMFLLRI